MRRRPLPRLATLASVSLLGLAACTREPSPAPGSSPAASVVGTAGQLHSPGQIASNAFFELSVRGVKLCSVEQHLQPGQGVKRIGVDVFIKSVGNAQVPANPFYALITNAEGERFEATLAGCQPVLQATQLPRGSSAEGWISFDVPETLRHAQLSYAPAILGAGKPELLFAIEP